MSAHERDTYRGDTQRTCDLLAAYELGLLEAAARSSFEAHLGDCDECLGELYAMAPTAAVLTTEPGRYLQAARTAVAARGGRRGFAGWLGWRAGLRILAPVVAVGLALFLFLPRANQQALFGPLAQIAPAPYTHIDVRSGGTAGIAASFTAGMSAYQNEDYDLAARELAAAAAAIAADPSAPAAHQPGLSDQIQLYLAVSLLLEARPRAALPHLDLAGESTIRPVSERALWYRAQAQLQLEEPEAALTALAALKNSPVYGPQAEALAARIKGMARP